MGGGCLRGNREEGSGGHLIGPTNGEPPKGLKGRSVLPEDGLPEEVGGGLYGAPRAGRPHSKPNWAGPGATEPGKGPESLQEALAALNPLPTHHLIPGQQAKVRVSP